MAYGARQDRRCQPVLCLPDAAAEPACTKHCNRNSRRSAQFRCDAQATHEVAACSMESAENISKARSLCVIPDTESQAPAERSIRYLTGETFVARLQTTLKEGFQKRKNAAPERRT